MSDQHVHSRVQSRLVWLGLAGLLFLTQADVALAAALRPFAILEDESLLDGSRTLQIRIAPNPLQGSWPANHLRFKCSFTNPREPGQVSVGFDFRRAIRESVQLEPGPGSARVRFDDGQVADVPILVGPRSTIIEGEAVAYEIAFQFPQRSAWQFLDSSMSSKEVTVGVFTKDGAMAQETFQLLPSRNDRSLYKLQLWHKLRLFDVRCRHPGELKAANETLASRRFDLSEGEELTVSFQDGLVIPDYSYSFRCTAASGDRVTMLLSKSSALPAHSGRAVVQFTFANGAVIETEAEVDRDGVLVEHATALLDAALMNERFVLRVRGERWEFGGGDPLLELFRGQCLVDRT